MKVKLKSGDVYDTDLPPYMQSLSKAGVEEIMYLLRGGKVGLAS